MSGSGWKIAGIGITTVRQAMAAHGRNHASGAACGVVPGAAAAILGTFVPRSATGSTPEGGTAMSDSELLGRFCLSYPNNMASIF